MAHLSVTWKPSPSGDSEELATGQGSSLCRFIREYQTMPSPSTGTGVSD